MFFKEITIAVTVAVFVLAAQTSDAKEESDGIAIPLTKRSDTTNAREFHATSYNAKIIRGSRSMDGSERNNGTSHSSAVQRDGSGTGLDLTKFGNGIWYGTIWIGAPPRPFTVQLNTGSSDLFVPALNGDRTCRTHRGLWDPASSPTTTIDLNIGFQARFVDGRSVSGKQYMDTVTIAGFTADRQVIGAATTYSSAMEATQFAPDGVLGLAFPSMSEFRGQRPLLHTLYYEGKLPRPVFSLKLTESGGELYVGGMNRALYRQSTLVYTPVTYAVLWQLRIDNIQVNGRTVVTDVAAIIDTGANFIYGDPPGVLALHKAAGGGAYHNYQASYHYGGGYYVFPCKKVPSVTFTIGGKPFLIPAYILNRGQVIYNSPNCFSAIAIAHTEHTFWTLGTFFLEQFYTVFDFNDQSPRVGFAQLA